MAGFLCKDEYGINLGLIYIFYTGVDVNKPLKQQTVE